MYSFSYLEPVCCSMSSSNCYFLTCIQISQEAGKLVYYSHLFNNFPEFVVFHSDRGFGIVNKAEVDVFLELSCFYDDPVDHPLEHLLDYRNGSFSDTEFVYFLLTNHDTMVLSKSDQIRSVTQSCPTLCDPMDCSLPGSSIHGIFQARILEWVVK